MTPEGRVKALVNKRLAPFLQRGDVWKFMPVQTGYGMPSLDYMLCVVGHFVCIETKAPGEKPTPRQKATIAAMRHAGGLVFVVDGIEAMDEVIACIRLLNWTSHQ